MDKQSKSAIDVVVTILSNVAAISVGVAFFNQKWWAFTIATVAALIAIALAWRAEQ